MGVPDPQTDPQFYDGVPLRRLIAFVLDTLVIVILWFVVLVLVFAISAATMGLALPVGILMLACTGLIYRWIMLWQRSATLGMMAVGVEVRDAQGEKCSPGIAFLHSIAFLVTLYFLPLAIIGWILMASSPHRRTMHDLMLGAVVINRPA